VCVAAGVGVGVEDCVWLGVALGVGVDCVATEALLVAVLFLTALFVAVGVADCVAALCAGVDATCFAPPTAGITPGNEETLVDEFICGGVIDKTAPRPPTVPPTINSARFMPELSRVILRSI
jgi:hypothetical protein